MKNNKGFSLVEIVIVITLIGTLLAVYVNRMGINEVSESKTSLLLMEGFGKIEDQYIVYLKDKNTKPTGLNDASFMPGYLTTIPLLPTGFNPGYGTSGYLLGYRTGQAAPNNGTYISTMVKVVNASDKKWLGIKKAASKLPSTKIYYNTTAPSTANMLAPAGSTDVYVTYWINRY